MPEHEIKPCIAMVGEPFHMSRCDRLTVWHNAGDVEADGTVATSTGWRHLDPADNATHGAVPKGWV